ncbi:MAG: xanthine dehydrogenase family protein molybdopterin-binding subunit [Candidatus Lambdaproteobacteria bacterium]|nr:xanthine dehydrogenase family protein molybdopterin-binding subunit [Candidatus Lambdaproteobacteria bacterium]
MERRSDAPASPYKVIGTRPIRHDGEDKVTGRAQFAADVNFRDQLYGKVLRSPHAHARILAVDVSRAQALPGVKAIATHQDLPTLGEAMLETGEGAENTKYMTDRILASDKALYKGHPIAAVAATDPWTAEQALGLIEVRYEPLPAVVDVLDAMQPDAPLLYPDVTTSTLGKRERKATNVIRHTRHQRGDIEKGFAQADHVIEREFRTATVHQGYIEPQACSALARSDGQITVWTGTQGAFPVREQLATLLKLPLSQIKVVPMEIGGGFGGKIQVYLEPLAVILSRKSGRPVKLGMTRADVFQATGPAPRVVSRIKLGVKRDGTLTAAKAWLVYECGAFPSVYGVMGANMVLAPYRLANVQVDSYDVLTNTSKTAAYRAPASPQALFGTEAVMDELAERLGMDPLELRLKNAVEEGDARVDGLVYPRLGLKECLRAALASDHYRSAPPKGPNRARAVALGYWHNNSFTSSATVGVNMDGTASVVTGSTDIGGSRASMAIMAAETLGLKAEEVRPSVADTDSIGHTDVTGGSRTTFATGYAVYEAAQDALAQLKTRVARLWDVPADQVEFREGAFHGTGDGKGDGKGNGHPPLTVRQLGKELARVGGPVLGSATVSPKGVGPGFGVHIADIEVDPETGKVTILRYTAVQDVGRAIHPAYVEGQMQGGVVQGIGWALNEEYVFNDQGEMLNPGFLDYRMPTMPDVPRIETILVEVPNPGHPYGVRGVGETPIVPPLGTLHNAIARAVGVRLRSLPMSPPKVVQALQEKARAEAVAARPG